MGGIEKEDKNEIYGLRDCWIEGLKDRSLKDRQTEFKENSKFLNSSILSDKKFGDVDVILVWVKGLHNASFEIP